MGAFTEKFDKIKKVINSKYCIPTFLATIFFASFIFNIFPSATLGAIFSVILLLVWLVLLLLQNFNNNLLIIIWLLPFRLIGAQFELLDTGIFSIFIAVFVGVYFLKHLINVKNNKETLKAIPLILCALCTLYSIRSYPIFFALIYVFYVNSQNINLKQISFNFIYSVISCSVLSLLYFAVFKQSIMLGKRFEALCLNPNILHIYTTIALSILIFLFSKKQCSNKLFFPLFTALSIIGVLTQSKAFIVCYVLLLIYLTIVILRNSKLIGFTFIGVFLFCLGLGLLLFTDSITSVFHRFFNAVGSSSIDKIFTGRISVWQSYLKVWLASPITTIFGCRVSYENLTSIAIHPHNDYIYFLYRFGIVGTLLVIATLVSFVIYSKNKKNFKFSNLLPFAICLILSFEECITGLLFLPLYVICACLLFYKHEKVNLKDIKNKNI